jgi:hypothetical protein
MNEVNEHLAEEGVHSSIVAVISPDLEGETWDHEVADGRQDDFIAALKNSQMVMEYVRFDEEPSAA